MTTGKRFNAEIEVSLRDHFTAEIRGIVRALKGLEDAQKKSEKASKWAGRAAAARDMADFSRDVAMAAAKPVQVFADFEEQMDSVAAATFDMTKAMDPAEMKAMEKAVAELSATARKLGSDTRYSASEAAAGMDILAKNFAGSDFEKAEAVMKAMPGILDTAAATKETIAIAADVQSAAMNQFGLTAGDMGIIGDILVKTANSSATGLVDLGEALKYSGVTAHKAGIDLETTAAMIGALGNAGKKGSVAGTNLASVLSNVQSGAKKQKNALAALGINVADKKGNLKPIVELLGELQRAADKKFGKGTKGVERDDWLQGLVGMGGDKETLAILMEQAGTGELQKIVEANMAAEGTAKQVAAAMSDNAAGAARELDSAFEELQLTLGEAVIPTVKEGIEWAKEATASFTAWAKENPELVKGLGYVAAAIAFIGIASAAAAAVMMVNPIVAIGTGFALTAVLIYEYWEPISEFFEKHWGKVYALFAPVALMFAPIINAARLIMDNWEPVADFFTNLWNSVTSGFKSAMDWVLEQIKWVGDKVTDFRISIMSPEEFAAYEKEQAAAAEANARAVLGGDDDIDRAGSITGRGGIGDTSSELTGAGWGAGWQGIAAAENQADAIARMMGTGIYEQYGPAAPSSGQAASLAQKQQRDAGLLAAQLDSTDRMLAQGPAMMTKPEWDPVTGKRVGSKSELKITVDQQGRVTGAALKSDDPGFAMRMNTGSQ